MIILLLALIPFNQTLHDELLLMKDVDQVARIRLVEKNTKTLAKEVTELDQSHTKKLRNIIDKHGWPTLSMVNEDGADAMWLLAQHQDHDLAFQEKLLTLLKYAVESGDAPARHFAFLTDRVRIHKNLPQLYGTQWNQQEGKWFRYPVESPETLNERRLAMGLNSLEEERKLMIKYYKLSESDIPHVQ